MGFDLIGALRHLARLGAGAALGVAVLAVLLALAFCAQATPNPVTLNPEHWTCTGDHREPVTPGKPLLTRNVCHQWTRKDRLK